MAVNLFQAVFHDSSIPQAISDLRGTVIEANTAFQKLLRWPTPIIGVNSREFTVGQDTVLETNLQTGSWISNRQYLLGDDTCLQVTIHYAVLCENGRAQHILAQVQDVTAQHQMQQDLNKQREESEQFAYISSHDLREPLTSLVGFATLLQRRYADKLDDQGRHWLQEVINGAKRMDEKVDDLLDFSRAGRVTPTGIFSLGAALEEAKRALVKPIKENGATIHLQDSPLLNGDRSMVANVLQNLLSNSIKYRRDGIPPVITIAAESYKNQTWLIRVTDNGLGFDMLHRDRIFTIFQRLYTVEQYPGTGIGLAIAKKIVERHGGEIWAESISGSGSTFYLTLPAAPK